MTTIAPITARPAATKSPSIDLMVLAIMCVERRGCSVILLAELSGLSMGRRRLIFRAQANAAQNAQSAPENEIS